MPNQQLPFFGRETELQLLHTAWRAATDATTRTSQIVTLVAETGVGKSRIIQEFYRQLTVDTLWDPDNFWPDAFQSHATQLRVNPEFPADYAPDGPPRFLWLGMRWTNADERNVANSLALPTLKEQVIDFSQRVKQFQSRWQHALHALIASGKEIATAEELLKIVAGNLVPFADVAISLFAPVVKPEGPPPTLPEQLMELFYAWFARMQTPIILWLDDAQWMDAEAQAFFTQLMHTARNKRWPLLLIATSWPAEWRVFPHDFFLKHDTATIYDLGNAADAELQQLLYAAFPQLPHDQVVLIVDRAGGNFLTMIENIAELRREPMYFVHGDSTQPLAVKGIEKIRTWESNRQKRILQRFEGFEPTIRYFLARASHAGLNTQFMHNVLRRWSQTYPSVGDVDTLLHRSQEALAVVMPFSPQLHEFRDRGYFVVARQYFSEWLETDEAQSLKTALIAELTERVQSAFDADGNLCNPQVYPTSLRAAPSREQHVILALSFTMLSTNTLAYAQAFIVMIAQCAAENSWNEIRSLTSHCTSIHWSHHVPFLHTETLKKCAESLKDTGLILQAEQIYQSLWEYWQTTYTNTPTSNAQYHLTHALNNIGRIYQTNGNLMMAERHFNHALIHARQLVNQHNNVQYLQVLATSLTLVGRIYRSHTNLVAALYCFDEALNIKQQLISLAENPENLHELSIALNYVGRIHRSNQNFDTALNYFTESLRIRRKLANTLHNSENLHGLSLVLNHIGRIYRKYSDYTKALEYFTESLTIKRQLVTIRGIPEDLSGLSITLNHIGRIHRYHKNTTQALSHFMESLSIKRQLVEIRGTPEDIKGVSITLNHIGRIQLENTNIEEALAHFEESLTLKRQLVEVRGTPEDYKALMITLTYITRIHYHNGNTILATQYTKETDFISQKLQQLITAMQTKKQPMPLDDRTGEGDDEE